MRCVPVIEPCVAACDALRDASSASLRNDPQRSMDAALLLAIHPFQALFEFCRAAAHDPPRDHEVTYPM